VFCPILEFRKKKRTFTKVEEVNVDFFLKKKRMLEANATGSSFLFMGSLNSHWLEIDVFGAKADHGPRQTPVQLLARPTLSSSRPDSSAARRPSP
jgi:hypothetical protein